MTNGPATVWTAEVVATGYRMRWQIAWVFNQWKAGLQLQGLRGTRPERIRRLRYGRLMTRTMLMRVCSSAAWYAPSV